MNSSIDNKITQEVSIRIHASVSTTVRLEANETLQDVMARHVDIYLHGAGDTGHTNKEDLGADTYKIMVDDSDELVFVDKGLLLALIDTAKRSTDHEAVYDDERGTHYSWDEIGKVLSGLGASKPSMDTPAVL
tara:strand:+ start:49254 stop:49652 length:399 start_codon:yes stop_codon:yes gene_type:complete